MYFEGQSVCCYFTVFLPSRLLQTYLPDHLTWYPESTDLPPVVMVGHSTYNVNCCTQWEVFYFKICHSCQIRRSRVFYSVVYASWSLGSVVFWNSVSLCISPGYRQSLIEGGATSSHALLPRPQSAHITLFPTTGSGSTLTRDPLGTSGKNGSLPLLAFPQNIWTQSVNHLSLSFLILTLISVIYFVLLEK